MFVVVSMVVTVTELGYASRAICDTAAMSHCVIGAHYVRFQSPCIFMFPAISVLLGLMGGRARFTM